MGYAQLAEGRVENLDVADEIERAIEQVFPPGSEFDTTIERNIEPDLPALKMQRGHLNEILVNILKNSRDVQNNDARIEIHARQDKEFQVTITIDDNGPGIPPERGEQVFEPYFTTKDTGSGLGLSIVKHNTEIYGGQVRVAAGALKGARFEIELPTRTLMRLSN
jgi:signal transduction histidine kinase